jgi:hypothetical protein
MPAPTFPKTPCPPHLPVPHVPSSDTTAGLGATPFLPPAAPALVGADSKQTKAADRSAQYRFHQTHGSSSAAGTQAALPPPPATLPPQDAPPHRPAPQELDAYLKEHASDCRRYLVRLPTLSGGKNDLLSTPGTAQEHDESCIAKLHGQVASLSDKTVAAMGEDNIRNNAYGDISFKIYISLVIKDLLEWRGLGGRLPFDITKGVAIAYADLAFGWHKPGNEKSNAPPSTFAQRLRTCTMPTCTMLIDRMAAFRHNIPVLVHLTQAFQKVTANTRQGYFSSFIRIANSYQAKKLGESSPTKTPTGSAVARLVSDALVDGCFSEANFDAMFADNFDSKIHHQTAVRMHFRKALQTIAPASSGQKRTPESDPAAEPPQPAKKRQCTEAALQTAVCSPEHPAPAADSTNNSAAQQQPTTLTAFGAELEELFPGGNALFDSDLTSKR